MQAHWFRDTALGRMGIEETDGRITRLFLPADTALPDSARRETPLLRQAFTQLEGYLSRMIRDFSLPLEPAGTPFQRRVWQALLAVPYGRTATYKDIAAALGNPLACRAVGLANSKNPIPIFIPCHRIVGTNGKLTGFRGGLAMKQALLNLEAPR